MPAFTLLNGVDELARVLGGLPDRIRDVAELVVRLDGFAQDRAEGDVLLPEQRRARGGMENQQRSGERDGDDGEMGENASRGHRDPPDAVLALTAIDESVSAASSPRIAFSSEAMASIWTPRTGSASASARS